MRTYDEFIWPEPDYKEPSEGDVRLVYGDDGTVEVWQFTSGEWVERLSEPS